MDHQLIVENYLRKIITSELYNSPNPIRDTGLLVPEFAGALSLSIGKFNETYPDVKIVYVETYRSNVLQLQHYNNGASKIRKNGMHHYAIACDLAFNINGVFTYKGDYDLLRECHKEQGLFLLGAWDIGHVQGIDVPEQMALRNAVDTAIRDFQSENGLVADGIVGGLTIAKAKEVFNIA